MKTAHYTASSKAKYVTISETLRPVGTRIAVTGKREARKVAQQHNATPWNF